MLSNLHTHSTFSDGKNTPEEIIEFSIAKGLNLIGFSDHGYTDFDLSYCVQNMDEYISSINSLKSKYKNKIKVYLGVEEDIYCPVERSKYDYIISSSHYFKIHGEYYPIDLSVSSFNYALQKFDNDIELLARSYYEPFCDFIRKRKPDIIGHFDLITKFDELDSQQLMLNNRKYIRVASDFISSVVSVGSVFEVNTGAISRGYRNFPYPSEDLLAILKKEGGRVTISSDCHNVEALDYHFNETKLYLKDIGFSSIYTFVDGMFVEERI